MIRTAILVLALCVTSLSAAAAPSASAPGAREFAYGYFCRLPPVGEGEAAGTVSGTVVFVEGPPVFQGYGPEVPAQLGVGFGVHVTVRPGFSGAATLTVEHPPMGPEGVTRQTWVKAFEPGVVNYTGYVFDHGYEILRGPWRMRAEINGRLMYDVAFEVVDRSELPAVRCSDMLS